jgi:exopolysaccharide biosynthesis operon protein EpsL
VDSTAAIGSSSRGDTYRTTSLGLRLDLPVSRQRFQADAAVSHVRYDHFSALNFNGHDLRANWLWQAGDRTSGRLGYSDGLSLVSYSYLLGTTPDRLRLRQAYASGAYMLTPVWKIGASLDGLTQRNSDPPRQVNDADILASEISTGYVSGAGNSLGVSLRTESGRFPNPQPVGTDLVNNAYQQYSAGVVAVWTPSGTSHVGARVDRVSRRYQELPQRDVDGTTWHAEYEWKPTGKTSLVAIARREISPYEYIRSSLVLVQGVALRPSLRMSEKTEVAANLESGTRRYAGDPAVALGLSSERVDHVRTAGALVSYRPVRIVTLQLSAYHESRTSNVDFGDYSANVVYLSGRLAF